jgi:hypothetical protein
MTYVHCDTEPVEFISQIVIGSKSHMVGGGHNAAFGRTLLLLKKQHMPKLVPDTAIRMLEPYAPEIYFRGATLGSTGGS